MKYCFTKGKPSFTPQLLFLSPEKEKYLMQLNAALYDWTWILLKDDFAVCSIMPVLLDLESRRFYSITLGIKNTEHVW